MINTVEKIYKDGEFIMYQLTLNNGQVWSVSLDESNRHYQEIQDWIAKGNTVIDNPPE